MIDPKEVLEICGRATPGPWKVVEGKSFGVQSENKNIASCFRTENEQFIALARTAMPELAQRVIKLEAENARLRETVVEWNEVGEAIMDAVVGRKAPLSDSDVIGEVARLRYENAKLRAVAEAAEKATTNATDTLRNVNGNFIVECWNIEPEDMDDLMIALAAAGYGGEE